MYKEDFEQERKDRENAVSKRDELSKQSSVVAVKQLRDQLSEVEQRLFQQLKAVSAEEEKNRTLLAQLDHYRRRAQDSEAELEEEQQKSALLKEKVRALSSSRPQDQGNCQEEWTSDRLREQMRDQVRSVVNESV